MRAPRAIVMLAALAACGRAGFDPVTGDAPAVEDIVPPGDGNAAARPVLWFRFDETTGMPVANSGTLATQVMAAYAQQGVAGQVGRAISLAAPADGVELADQAALDGFTQLTIAGWMYFDGFNAINYSTVLKKDMAYILRTCDAASCGTSRVISAIVWDSAGAQHSINVTITPATGTWYHIALTYDGSQKPYTLKAFWNGVRLGNTGFNTGTGAVQDSAIPLTIGRGDPSGENLTGRLDEVRLWDRTLTEQEICEDAGRTWTGTLCN